MSASPAESTRNIRSLQFGLRDLLLVAAVIAVYLAACVAIFRGLSTREVLASVGLVVPILVGTIIALKFIGPRWANRRAGPMVVALQLEKSRREWIVWACWLPLVILLVFPLVDEWPAWLLTKRGGPVPISRMQGLLIIWMIQNACFAINSFVRRSLVLCENGLVRDGVFFDRWRKLPRNSWSIDEEGNLRALVSRWRVVATVPPADRDAVLSLLNERLG